MRQYIEIMDISNKKLEGIKKREANLRPAKKGEVRNPKGRPKKGFAIADILNQIADEIVIFKNQKMSKNPK